MEDGFKETVCSLVIICIILIDFFPSTYFYNFYPLEVVSHHRDSQLQVDQIISYYFIVCNYDTLCLILRSLFPEP